ncbi:N-acetyl-alpha-D-glucosaminyl-diphospho-ditrans, octacis-undecaprenol 4-epimerase [Comamonadaceae bacterium OS-1]|nr:N-acetyl-alpha-D-glucosaminyl-diphospho-ditrans, octacis-undecaprenol 4-epimerase [Comamonadaceae bacterium OS-1]
MKVLVTGATGFVGRALLIHLQTLRQFRVRAAVRATSVERLPAGVKYVQVGDLDGDTDWHAALAGMDAVVHLAARVHVMHELAHDPLQAYRQINVAGSLRLAQMAVEAGVQRMVFVSSIKVNGEATPAHQPFSETSPCTPKDAYSVSKLETEQALRTLAQSTGLELTILRPPLVYGHGVGANFAALARAVASGVPLPLGCIDNQRSLLAAENLVDLITTCLTHPAAAHQTFMASDGEDLSTTELVQRIALAMQRSVWLLPVPGWMLLASASLMGRQATAQRLCGNLQVDSRKARTLLQWTPPATVDDALSRALVGYRK